DVDVVVERGEEGVVLRLFVSRRLQGVELLHAFLDDRQHGTKIAGRVRRVRRPAWDLEDGVRLPRADGGGPLLELRLGETAGAAAARGERDEREHQREASHAGARSSTRSEGASKPKRR